MKKLLRKPKTLLKPKRDGGFMVRASEIAAFLKLCTRFSFNLIIVDEAAQSVELSTLIPLRFNCKKMILVGL